MSDDVDELLAGCLKNDRRCQKRLYEKFSPALFAVCRRYANSETDAEDMLADGFVSIFNSLHTYRGDSSLQHWMRSVMLKTAIDYFRKNKKHYNNQPFEDVLPKELIYDDSKIYTKLEAENILKIMEKMPEEWRVIFNLRIMEEYSFKEISDELGKNENTVRVYFLRGKKWLTDQLKNE